MRPSDVEATGEPTLRSRTFRAIAAVLCVAVAWTPWALVWADDIARQGRAGQALGRAAAEGFTQPRLQDDGGLVLSVDGAAETVAPEALFPGAASGAASDFTALYGQEQGLAAKGHAAQADLLDDDSAHAEAFQALYGTVGRHRPDLRIDPVWVQTDQVLGDLEAITAAFGDCAIDTRFETDTRLVHLPEIETCQQVQQGGACIIRHHYDLPPADHIVTAVGGAVVANCGRGCIDVRYDFAGSGHVPACADCAYLPAQTFGFRVHDSARIARIRVSVDPEATEFDTGCDWDCRIDALSQSWAIRFPGYQASDHSQVNFDAITREALHAREMTEQLRQGGDFTVANDYRFRTDGGHWYVAQAPYRVRVRIDFEPLPLHDHGWAASEACIALAQSIRSSGFCAGEASCLGAPALNSDGCYEDVGVIVCPGDFGASPVPWLSPFCREIAIRSDCAGFNSGPMRCWTDPQGERHCPFNAGDIANDCEPLEADPACGYLGSVCVDGARDPNGFCYVTESRYDCGRSAGVPDVSRSSTMDCAGPVRCLGNDCLDLAFEQSEDFAEAAAALQAAQFTLMDADCTGQGQCRVFRGEAAECKQAVGGVVDCCDTPAGVSLTDYIQLIFALSKIDSAIMALDAGSAIRGGWELLRDPLVDSWDAVSEAFTSAANTLTGNTTAAVSDAAAQVSLDAAKQALMRQTAQWTANVFGDAAANALFAVEGGGQAVVGGTVQAGQLQLGGLVGTTLGWAMTAYMIYSVVMILIRILWTCEEDEFELGAKRELRACHYVGSYCDSEVLGLCIEKQKAFCCFNTPLARIVNEQAYPQLGRRWGEAEQPDCSGLSLNELERLDWSRIDLSEWLAILHEAGQFPSPEDLDVEALTGSGSVLDTGGRADVAERSQERAAGLDHGRINRDVEERSWERVLETLP